MLELLLALRDFSGLSFFLDFNDGVDMIDDDSLMPKLLELADDDDDVVETDAPDDVETDVRMLFDFFNDILVLDDEGQRGFSRHSSGLNEEKSARIPLSVIRDKIA